MTEADHEVRLRMLEGNHDELQEAVKSIRDSLQSLVRLEERHIETKQSINRAFVELKSVDDRVKDIEIEIPALKEVRGWIITGVLGVMGLVGIALLTLVVGIK